MEYGAWTDWLLCLGVAVSLGARWPMRNPEGHSPRWRQRHSAELAAVSIAGDSGAGMPAEHKNRGLEYLLAAVALLAEFLAVGLGEVWLGWGAAVLFWVAIYEYTKPLRRSRARLGARILAALVLTVAMRYALIAMETHIRARMMTEPRLYFSVMNDRTIVLDNSKGYDLQDFKVDALEYYLDGVSFANNHAKVATRNVYGGDLDFKHFDVRSGEIKLFRPTEYLRYRLLLDWHRPAQDAPQTFDSMIHYWCLRFTFTKMETGETFVHYVVISPYGDKFDYAGSPEHVAGQEQAGDEGFPFSIARNIKADARTFYGTEYREYQP